ncbi:hypothetical protein PM032_02470 [Halorubrum ezzemoulense]|uniref:hypothetical protein n=1 Tax=Halorubrum ezzemoulense TaxID=337243 RepID=UPI00232CDA15|nr:hypothetical protein [Halorubrum ezzemoulense]MDB2269885.1 hypothetical protein [Halorubrum ezzemoulense]
MNLFTPNNIAKKITKIQFLSPLLLIIGTFGLYFSTIIRNPYTLLYPSSLILAPILFYVLRSQIDTSKIDPNYLTDKTILIMFLLTFSTLVFQYYIAGFQRTDLVFYITFLLYLLTALYIHTQPHPILGLNMILIAGITNRLTAYYDTALYNGVDVYSHSRLVQSIADNGTMDVLVTNKYFYAPFYHLLGAAADLIYIVPTRDAIALTTLLAVTVLPVLTAYLITVYFWNPRIGLLAGFLYITADHSIRWGTHVIPTSLGIAFFALLILSLIKYMSWGNKRQFFLIIVFMISLMFTHQVSLFIGVTTIGALGISMIIFNTNLSKTSMNIGLVTGLIMILDFIVTKYSGPIGSNSFLDIVLGNLVTSLLNAGTETRPEVAFPQDPSIYPSGAAALTLPQVAGSALLLIFAIVGALYWLTERRADRELLVGIGLCSIITVLIFTTLIGPMVGVRNLLPTRWWPFTYILLAVLAAPGLLVLIRGTSGVITSISGNVGVANIVVVIIVFMLPYVVLMGGNFAGAPDRPLFNEAPGAERFGIQETEKKGFVHISQYTTENQEILTDRRGTSILSRYYGINANTISIEYGHIESIKTPSILFDREYLSTPHAQYYIRIEQDIITVHGGFNTNKISSNKRNTIYDSGDDQMLYLT